MDVYAISTSADRTRTNYPPSKWLEDEGWSVPTLVDDGDGSAATAFGLSAFPFTVYVDADGRVLGRLVGEVQVEEFVAILESIAGG